MFKEGLLAGLLQSIWRMARYGEIIQAMTKSIWTALYFSLKIMDIRIAVNLVWWVNTKLYLSDLLYCHYLLGLGSRSLFCFLIIESHCEKKIFFARQDISNTTSIMTWNEKHLLILISRQFTEMIAWLHNKNKNYLSVDGSLSWYDIHPKHVLSVHTVAALSHWLL